MIKLMKALCLGFLLLGIGACSSNSSTNTPSLQPEALFVLRAYGGNLETALDLTLSIYEDHPGYAVYLLMNNEEYKSYSEILWSGDLLLETIEEIRIFDIPWVEFPEELTESIITMLNSEQGLVLQNYGNAMNYYQVLPFDYKYIYFLPVEE